MVLEIFQDKTKSKRCDIAMQKNESRQHCCVKGKGIYSGTCYVIWAFSKRHASEAPTPSWSWMHIKKGKPGVVTSAMICSALASLWKFQYLRNFGMFVFFPYFPRIMRIHFSHVLGIVCISASSKIFKKLINLKCLCFPILFPYYGNPLSRCVGKCTDFCFQQKIPETPWLWNVHVFPYFFLTVRIHFSHILGIVCINATHEVCKKPIALECLCFPILFPYNENSVTSHVFGIVWVSISREIE